MDPSAIDTVLAGAVHRGAVPNVVAVVADRDGVLYEGAAGPRAAGGDAPVGPDSVFRIASMTKMVATTAALQLVERGALDLDAPVEKYRPEFADLRVLTGFDGDTPTLRPPSTPPTVHQLVTHTAGLGYWFDTAELVRWEGLTGTPNAITGDGGMFRAPLTTDPGVRWHYGTNIDWLGRVVEVAAGQSLDAYLDAHVLGPLGMHDTTFTVTEAQRDRLVPVHAHGPDGWVATDMEWNQRPDWWSGGHGLYSTARDYLAFQRMLLGGGALGDARILRAETVDAAFRNQIGDLDVPATLHTADPTVFHDVTLGPGLKWGLGLLLNTEAYPGMRAPGSGGWSGIFNSHFWVDRASGVTAAIYLQLLPFAEPSAFALAAEFEQACYAAL